MKKILTLIFIIILTTSIYGKEKITITFLHTNDMHGHIFPYENKKISENKIGGFQYLSAFVNKEREKSPGKVLLLDGGDFAQGTIWSNLDFGIPSVELMNKMKYDCTVVGNHEFDWGMDKLEHMISTASFPVLSSNVVNKKEGDFIKGTEPYIIKNIDGIRIGIIGFTCTDTSIVNYRVKNDYDFLKAEEILNNYINLLRNLHKADIIVLLSHEGYQKDREIAMKVSGIDLIIGGHSNTVLEEPVKVENTIITQAGCYLAYIGKVDIEYDKDEKKITDYKGNLIKLDNLFIEPDNEMNSILEHYKKKYEAMADEVIGKTNVELKIDKRNEANLGNMAADIIKNYGEAQIGIINSGAIRENIPAGNITIEKIYSVFPFDDVIVSMDLKGSDLIEIMSNNVEQKHGILQISGLKATYDLTRPEGQKLITLTAGDKLVDPKGFYRVATVDFLALGGNDFSTFKKGENRKDMVNLRDAIIDYIKTQTSIYCEVEGRQAILQ